MSEWTPPDAKGMSDWEVAFARKLLREFVVKFQRPTTYLEIGSRAGGSLWHFGTALPLGSRLISVDSRPSKHKTQGIARQLSETCEKLRRLGHQVVEITGDSHAPEILSSVVEAIGQSLDVLLIDGDHTETGVRQDVKDYIPLVRSGGLAILHDCGWQNQRYGWSKPGAKLILDTVNKVFREIAHDKRHVLAQELAGLGFIWV